jgi:hypothetical protein
LLNGVSDPLKVLKIVWEHRILCWSEPPNTFRPLEQLGWVVYREGAWRITDEGKKAALAAVAETVEVEDTPTSIAEFFGL